MPIRCGIDIAYIPDMVRLFKDEVVARRFFLPSELMVPELTRQGQKTSVSMEHLAGVVAAKEAFFKALGMVPKFLDVEVAYEASGRPKLVVAPKWEKFTSADVSISHDKDYAVAMVILEA
jgi:phosphopantetheine--protein transferase-like protein